MNTFIFHCYIQGHLLLMSIIIALSSDNVAFMISAFWDFLKFFSWFNSLFVWLFHVCLKQSNLTILNTETYLFLNILFIFERQREREQA